MNSKEIMVNLMVEKICKYIDAGDINKIVVHGKEFNEVKKGKWIGAEYDGYADGQPVYDVFECSNCGEIIFATDDTLTPFCPHCGADMRGDGE